MSIADCIADELRNMDDLSHGYLKQIAAKFGIGNNYLSVMLAREGSLFRPLLDAERRRRYDLLMKANPGASVKEQCKTLGVTSYTARIRILKRWKV